MKKERTEKICDAILNIACVTGSGYMIFAVISLILIEMQLLPEDFGVTTVGPLGLIPIAVFGFSKIVDTVTKQN